MALKELALHGSAAGILAAADPIELVVTEVLAGQFVEGAENFAHGTTEVEVLTAAVAEVVSLHEGREIGVRDD